MGRIVAYSLRRGDSIDGGKVPSNPVAHFMYRERNYGPAGEIGLPNVVNIWPRT